MNTKTLWLVVTVIGLLALLGGSAGALTAGTEPQDVGPLPDDAEIAADVPARINYQGRLTDASGLPLDGAYPMRFQLYSGASGGTQWWDSGTLSVAVDDGLFNAALDVIAPVFDGRELWLRIYVNGEWLSPRQALLPAPYALSLRPGAEIAGQPDPSGYVLRVEMAGAHATRAAVWGYTSTGDAVRGTSAGGYGLAGYTDDGYAVRGLDSGTTQARGYGGYFSSANGIGVYGYSSGLTTASNAYAPGVYGRSQNGVGVYGLSDTSRAGVYGESTSSFGVYGRSSTDAGVYGYSSSDVGVYGYTGGNDSNDYGVLGRGGDGTYAVRGYKSGSGSGLGVYGQNDGTGSGVSGNSVSYVGVYAYTARGDNNWGLYTSDNIHYASVTALGAEMQVVQNGDTAPLEVGDVVEIAGMDAPLDEGLPPVILVRRVREAGSSAVLGVVASGYAREWLNAPPEGPTDPDSALLQSQTGPIAPGETLQVVVRGPAQVKVAGGAFNLGDLLSGGAVVGCAQRAALVSIEGVELAPPGSVLGKALEAWDGGEGLIYVYITLQ
ncbi:MAG: hypothetical protein RBT75_11110 [Anaerolineae bacterium]|jgi:hypothetical protein|nr:hypothetical protein [Anaerolineae bacterium]